MYLAETKILISTYFEPYHISLGTYVLWKVLDVLKNGANGLGKVSTGLWKISDGIGKMSDGLRLVTDVLGKF